MSLKFIDEIEINIRAGNGGSGCISFLREKYRPQGGPDGGDGGRGGDVFLFASTGVQSLGHLLKRRIFNASNGKPGYSHNRSGGDGEDLLIHLPVGTQAENAVTGEIIGDLIHPEMRLLAAKGGRGGQGNQHFATSVKQSPEYAQPGLPGEKITLKLHLKLIADVGLVGLPNAGKSTLLSYLSRSSPKIAAYPFTTLTPNLGVIENNKYRRLLIADIPGIIEGASRGAGLGLSFLRHIERVRMIVYVIDIGNQDITQDIRTLHSELQHYSSVLLKRPALIVLNKIDLVDSDKDFIREVAKELTDEYLWAQSETVPEVICISALSGEGVEEFKNVLFNNTTDKTFAEYMMKKQE